MQAESEVEVRERDSHGPARARSRRPSRRLLTAALLLGALAALVAAGAWGLAHAHADPTGNPPHWLAWAALGAFGVAGIASFLLVSRLLRGREREEQVSLELDRRRREAEAANRAKNDFISSMAHELRTPLATIRMFTDLMRKDERGPAEEDQLRGLDDIDAAAGHMLKLLDDTMDIARVEAGRLELRPERVSIAALAIGVVDALRPLAQQRGISLSLKAAGGLGEVYLDPGRVRQVMTNYLTNALKFTERGGRVTMRIRGHGPGSLAIAVDDTGIGIAADDLDQVFGAMRRIAQPVHEQDSHRGLGLALTKRIVEAMGGHVGVRSRVGLGSSFYAVLPRVNAGRQGGSRHGTADRGASVSDARAAAG